MSNDQIEIIVNQICSILNLEEEDKLLDIGCGNGALSSLIAPKVKQCTGIDPSEYLIDIANENFAKCNVCFQIMDTNSLIKRPRINGYNKCLMYGVSSFLDDEEISSFIDWFFSGNKSSLMLGNVRDRALAKEFYGKEPNLNELNDCGSSMGKWRTQKWFMSLANKKGLHVKIHKMPENFYAEKYYFDVLLTHDSQ